MAKPDRAARVARVVKRWKDCVWSPRSQGTLMRDDILRLVEREVKRAVAEEREAIASEVETPEVGVGTDTGRLHRNAMRQGIAAAIRGRK